MEEAHHYPGVASPREESGSATGMIMHAARSLKWSFLYNSVPRLITPFSTLILAAILTPSDFGVLAIANFILALAQIVADLGLGEAVIQRRTRYLEAASVSFWINMTIAMCLYFLLWLAAPALASTYGEPQVVSIIRVTAISLLVYASATIPKSILRRKMEFRGLFWVNSSLLVVQAVVAVALALCRMGVWALVLGQLAGVCASAALAWAIARWRPALRLEWKLFSVLLAFSFWVTISGLLDWMFLYADKAIAGYFFGTKGLGVYSLGFNVAIVIPALLAMSLGDVAYPVLCRLQGDPATIGGNLVKLQALTGTVLFPLAFGISALAPPAVELLYGSKWEGLGGVIGLLVFMPGLGYLWSLNQKAYQAIGRPSLWTWLSGGSLLLLLPVLWLAAPRGLLVFSAARFAGGLLLPLGNIFLGARALGVGAREQLKALASPFLFSLFMFVAVHGMREALSPFSGGSGWAKLLLISLTGALLYALLVRLLNPDTWHRIILSLRQVFLQQSL